MVSTEYSEAIVEVLEILKYSDENITEKIPKRIIEFWQRNKSITYKPNLDHTKPINEMNIKNKTKSIIGMIYLSYLCNDTQKDNMIQILKDNEEKYQQQLQEKYNPNGIFKKQVQKQNIETNSISLVKSKKSILKRIINKIKSFYNYK